jgi:hypothetical protein
MPVDVRGRVQYSKDAEEEYTIDCKQLGIEDTGSGDIQEDIDDLTERITAAISEEFKVAPSAVQIVSYSMNISFSIEGPINKTLDEFVKDPEQEKAGDPA